MRDDRERLLDILEAIERIERYVGHGREAFDQDELIQNWMVHNLQVIGEAVRVLSKPTLDRHPEVNWADIVGMRTILVHRYFDIDTDVVWAAVTEDVPQLKAQVQAILAQWSDDPPAA